MNFIVTPDRALIGACALVALTLITIAIIGSRGARARHAEKARTWAEIKRPEWEARAARKREARASGAQLQARIRRALMVAVAIVALGATNLSAHGTIDAMAIIGLRSLDTAISVIVVFEMFLAILGALSYWHMHHGTGFNRYELGVWLMAALMGGIAWWGAGSVIYALWPMLAAVAWHLVITFGREHKVSPIVRWVRLRLGRATAQDATALDTERRISRIVHFAFMANEGPKLARALYERSFNRAWARADELGILSAEVRARIQTRLAARYEGARALERSKVEHMNPWNERAMSARHAARTVRPVSAPPAPAIEASAQVPDDARALTEAIEPVSAPVATSSAHSKSDLIDAIEIYFGSKNEAAKEWAKTFVEKNGELPTGDDLAVAFKKTAGNCRKWMTPVRVALGLS